MNILITGASGGIGAGVAAALHAQGHRLALHYKANLPPACGAHLQGDLTQPESGEALARQAIAALGHLDALVCCHGTAHQALTQDTSEADWAALFETNVASIHRVLRGVLPQMIGRKAGSIVLLSSMWGQVGAACEVGYSAAKGAVIALSKALAKEVAPSGIRVNCVAPGLIETAMNHQLSPEEKQDLVDITPMHRIGTPADIGHAVSFLVSEQASFVTGQTLTVDGGFTL